MSLSEKNDDFLMVMIIYVSMSLSDRVIKDHYYGGIIACASERHDRVPGL